MLESIYQWGAVSFAALGLIYAVVAAIRGDYPFIGGSKFGDSVAGRIIVGVGIAMIWPAFVAFLALSGFLRLLGLTKDEKWRI